MSTPDTAKTVKDELAANWTAPAGITATPTLHVDDDFTPAGRNVALLVADDGGPALLRGPWAWGRAAPAQPRRPIARRPLIRLTSFAKGRNDARETAQDAADWVVDHKGACGITRVDDVPDPLITRDRATGAYLASITMPVIVRQGP